MKNYTNTAKNTNKTNMDRANLVFKSIFLISILLYFTGCENADVASSNPVLSCNTLSGTYVSDLDSSETLTIPNDCTFTDSYCGYNATYTVPTASGLTDITILGTNGTPGCMASITHNCQVDYSATSLQIDCGGSNQFLFWRL